MSESTPASAAAGTGHGDGRVRRWHFADCVLDARSHDLRVRGAIVTLERKPLELLMFLLRHPGEVVTKDELQDAVWPGRILSESVLTKAVAKLRLALGDGEQQLIRTVHGYGYRLDAAVRVEDGDCAPAGSALGLQAGDAPPLRPLWRLVEPLGSGGSGEVWRIEHTKTHESRVCKFALDAAGLVALKREVTLYRVLVETYGECADAVRLLDYNFDHPPCFVEAEYLAGGGLSDWFARRSATTEVPRALRLELLAQAAQALAAAHAAGVLHKDVKPGNLLIVEHDDGRVQVKLADFGSGALADPARLDALGITRIDLTLAEAGAPGGTLQYLAPERLAGQRPTVQSDIYALGVVLYQLLVGDFRRPLAPGWERDIDDELLREDIAAAAASQPQQRLRDAAELAQRLRTLDQRRHQKARLDAVEQEARELRMHLLEARGRRRLQRAVSATLALGVLASGWSLWQARTERDRATAAAAEARATVEFLAEDILAATDPFGGGRPRLSLKALLDEAAPRLVERLADYPAARAEMGYAMGRAYEGLGDWPQAQARLQLAHGEAVSALGADDPLSLEIAERLAHVAMLQSQYAQAEDILSDVFDRRRATLGAQHPDVLGTRDALAWLEFERGAFEHATELYEALAADVRRDRPEMLDSVLWSLADCYLELSRLSDAERLMREVIAQTVERQGAQHPRALWQHTTLGDALMMQGRWDEAAAAFAHAYQGLVTAVGEQHPYTLTALHFRGLLLLERGDAVAALPLLRRAYDSRVQIHGVDHSWARYSANRVGEAMIALGLIDEAIDLLERAHADSLRVQTPQHPDVITIRTTLGRALTAAGRYAEAERLLGEALRYAHKTLPKASTRTALTEQAFGELRLRQRQTAEARELLQSARLRWIAAGGEQHPVTTRIDALLASLPAA